MAGGVRHLDLLRAARRWTVLGRLDADAVEVVYLLPASGLFMAVIYPTLNAKGISCVPKSEHGAAAGVILFFTCLSAVIAPLAMGALSDVTGQIANGFWLATGLAALLFVGLLLNWVANPTHSVLARGDVATTARNLLFELACRGGRIRAPPLSRGVEVEVPCHWHRPPGRRWSD
jgi:MFS family permease